MPAAAGEFLAEVTQEDVERLANRLAMMVSEEGEAANAGRAVAQLARRLGLTGGELKDMFLHGATGLPRPPPVDKRGPEVERLERELGVLRKSLRLTEANYRDLEREKNAIAAELEALKVRTDSARSASQLRFVLLGVIALALAGAAAVGWLVAINEQAPKPLATTGTPLPGNLPAAQPITPQPDFGPVVRRVGVIKVDRAIAYRQPDRTAPAIATMQTGMPVVVRRTFASAGVQWAEIEVGSAVGYMVLVEIDLS